MLKVLFAIVVIGSALDLKGQGDRKPATQFRMILEATGRFTDLNFSGNGQHLTFASEIEGQSDIYIIGLRETKATQITISKFLERNPVWSPDVKKVAYQKDSSNISSIWVYDFDRKTHKRISPTKENAFGPSWAPNNQTLAFSTDTYGSVDVIVKEFNSPKSRRLTAAEGDEFSFGFHPRGQYVGYYNRNANEQDLFAVAFTGKEAIPITQSLALEHQPVWCHNGARILFYAEDNGMRKIQTADFPYGELNSVAEASSNMQPIISPDGRWVIYEDNTKSKSDLYIAEVGNKKINNLGLNEIIKNSEMCWSPTGTIIALTTYNLEDGIGQIWLVSISDFVSRR